MFCRSYKELYTDENGKKHVLVTLVVDTTPTSDIDITQIDGFPKIYKEATDVVLCPGSVSICPDDDEVAMLGTDGSTWTVVTNIHIDV